MEKRKVKLRNQNKLTGTGYLFEYRLIQAGWNELPEEKKFGFADENMVVTFPHCIEPDGSVTELALFSDEVVLVD